MRLDGKIALVTGASRGIGAATARALAAAGAHVVATARTQGGLEELDDAIRAAGGAATLLPLDLADHAKIDTLGPSLYHRFGGLDILVHAAGALGRLTPVSHIREQEWAEVMTAGPVAAMRLIRTTAPLLLRAEAGRAVFLAGSQAPTAYWGIWGSAQAATIHLVQCWAAENQDRALRANLFDPGPTAGRLRAQAAPGIPPQELNQPDAVAAALLHLCTPEESRHGAMVRFAGGGV